MFKKSYLLLSLLLLTVALDAMQQSDQEIPEKQSLKEADYQSENLIAILTARSEGSTYHVVRYLGKIANAVCVRTFLKEYADKEKIDVFHIFSGALAGKVFGVKRELGNWSQDIPLEEDIDGTYSAWEKLVDNTMNEKGRDCQQKLLQKLIEKNK